MSRISGTNVSYQSNISAIKLNIQRFKYSGDERAHVSALKMKSPKVGSIPMTPLGGKIDMMNRGNKTTRFKGLNRQINLQDSVSPPRVDTKVPFKTGHATTRRPLNNPDRPTKTVNDGSSTPRPGKANPVATTTAGRGVNAVRATAARANLSPAKRAPARLPAQPIRSAIG